MPGNRNKMDYDQHIIQQQEQHDQQQARKSMAYAANPATRTEDGFYDDLEREAEDAKVN
jgi:hypothetical protein